jgi:hypothetical protein
VPRTAYATTGTCTAPETPHRLPLNHALRKTGRTMILFLPCVLVCGCQPGQSPSDMMSTLGATLPSSLQTAFVGTPGVSRPDSSSDPSTTNGANGANGIETTPLFGIFSEKPSNTSIPFNRQYPRVALTIVTVPPNAGQNWSQLRYLGGNVTRACFSLTAVLWTSRKHSEHIPPFSACFPDAGSKYANIPMAGMTDWSQRAGFFAVGVDESTGNRRSDGPVPPSLPVPTSPSYQAFYGGYPTLNAGTMTGGMFATLLLKMGFDWSVAEDRRVWLTRINTVEAN